MASIISVKRVWARLCRSARKTAVTGVNAVFILAILAAGPGTRLPATTADQPRLSAGAHAGRTQRPSSPSQRQAADQPTTIYLPLILSAGAARAALTPTPSTTAPAATATPAASVVPQATAQGYPAPTSTPGPAIDDKLAAELGAPVGLEAVTAVSFRGEWKLDGNLLDASGNSNHGSANPAGSASFVPGGCGGSGLYRNGSLLPVSLTNNNLTITGTTATLEGWVRSANYDGGFRHLIDNLDGYAISIKDGRVGAFFRGPSNWWTPTNTPLLSLNQWHYVVATYNGSQEALYLDGQLIANRSASGNITSGTGLVSLGGRGDGASVYLFNGTLDAVRVRDYALTPQQIADIYSSCKGVMPPSQAFAVDECPFCDNRQRVEIVGQGINAYSGNYNHQQSDGTAASLGNNLSFERSYNSLVTGNHVSYTLVYSDVLGYGWTHNFNVGLILSPTGELTTTRLLIAPRGSQLRFTDNGDGTYTPFAGVDVELTRSGSPGAYTYVAVTNSQYAYTFDNDGWLTSIEDPAQAVTQLTYTGGKLTRVTEPSTARWLELAYNGSGWIQSVTEYENGSPVGRSATYSYTGNDLTGATDLNGRAWTYTYSGNSLLERVIDPTNRTLVRTVYNGSGQATDQYDGQDQLIVHVDYPVDPPDQRTVVTLDAETGGLVTTTITYEGGLPQTVQDPQGNTTGVGFGPDLNARAQTNALAHTTEYVYADGNLTGIWDPLGHTTRLAYDSFNHLTQVVDALGLTTTFTYDGNQLRESIDALANTTLYTYTTPADAPEPANLVRARRDPSGAVTYYTYNALGQPLSVIANYQDGQFNPNAPDEDVATAYTYDALGRVETVTTAEGLVTRNAYNAAGDLSAVTRNYRADLPAYAEGIYNLTTAYGYDAAGRVVTTTTNLGSALARTDWTCYNEVGRVVRSVANASGADACDPGYVPSGDPAYDRVTQTIYDAGGNAIAVVDSGGTLGRVTRTYYDSLNRPVVVVENLTGQPVTELAPPAYSPATPDENVRAETVYDAAGNVLKTIDNAGQVNYNCYDELGRLTRTVQNPSVADPCAPYTPSPAADRDVTQQTVYDENGNVIATIDPAGTVARTYYDALNRPEYVAQNLAGQAITVTTPPSYSALQPDENLVTGTFYDADGRAYRQLDLTTNRSDWTCYDALGRVQKQVRNATADPCAPGYTPSAEPDEDVVTELVYDAQGRQIATIAPDGQVTRTYYDAAGRRLAQVQNLTGQSVATESLPAYSAAVPDENLTTLWGYDLLGRVVTTTLAAGSPQARTDWTCYDALGRAVRTVTGASGPNACDAGYTPSGQPDQDLIQETVYDDAGLAIATIDPAGNVTRTYYDGLYRPTVTVANLVGQPITAETPPAYDPAFPDRNLRHTTRYDAAGRTLETVDNAGMVTRTEYDLAGRPLTGTTNYAAGGPVDAVTNLRQVTVYDKRGSAVQQKDPNGLVTAFEYDALGRLTAVVENYRPGFSPTVEINVRTEYRYDSHGNRLAIRDGRATLAGQGYETTFDYDGLDRLVRETDPLGHTTTHTYNRLGLPVSLTDALTQTTTYGYDGLRRLILTDYPGAMANVSFAYRCICAVKKRVSA